MIIDAKPKNQSSPVGHWIMCRINVHSYEKQHIEKRVNISGDLWLVFGEPMKVCRCCHKTKEVK